MMKKENLVAILVLALIILVAIFLISYSSDFKQIIQGLAAIPGEGEDCTCDGIKMNTCVSGSSPTYCLGSGNPVTCSLVDNCGACGCPSDTSCHQSGSCLAGGDGGGSGSIDGCSNGTCIDEDGDGISDNCGSGGVCINGCCEASTCGDGVCDYREERCDSPLNCFEDCEGGIGKLGACGAKKICVEMFEGAGYGFCSDYEAPIDACPDGTIPESCSIVTYGGYCQYDSDAEDYLLTGSCGGLCPCPENYICEDDGFCIEGFFDETEEILESPVIIEDYCEYVGGKCQEECSSGYFPLNVDEYSELVEDCQNENPGYTCCYPYKNDDVNDCEYYGGSCLASCGEDYYYANVGYIDDECTYYGNTGDICCIPYETQVGENTEEVEIDGGNWINSLFSDEASEDRKERNVGLSENISLNRGVITGIALTIAALGYLIYLSFLKKKKRKR